MRKPGDKVDRYVIEATLGRGGMGEVYEAVDTRLGRRVALKLIPPGADPDANARMLREARAAASFAHPNVVVVFDVGEADGATYLAMELVRGTALRAFVGDAAVPVGRRLRWLVDVARALGAAHQQGIVHRDVKPDNVMVRDDGVAKVLDFGIARRSRGAIDPSAPTEAGSAPMSTITAAGVIVGTPQYAAPEQLRGEAVDGRVDEFAWGVMAYELLAGAAPWKGGDAMALLSQILSAEPAPLDTHAPGLPRPVVEAVGRALAKRAEDRFATIDEAADALEPFADAASTSTPGKRLAGERGIAAATPRRPTTVGRVARGTGKVVIAFFAVIGGFIFAAIVFGAATGKLELNGHRLGAHDAGADAGALVIDAVGCRDARLEGEGASPELARAIGWAACARLATEVGVDWRGEGAATPLEVTATLKAGLAVVTLAVAGKRVEGSGQTPIDAIVAASAALVKELAPPPMSDADVRGWGAADAASARRIERAWRRLLLNLSPNDEEAAKALVASDPGSAWSHLLFVLVRPKGTEESRAATARGLALVDALPPARAHALRGTFLIVDASGPEQIQQAMRLFQLGYTEAPDDGDVAGLYAAVSISVGSQEEGFAVLDRLCARFPTRSVLPLHNALSETVDRDLERDARYVAKLRAILPESFAWEDTIHHLGQTRRFDEARAAIAFGRRLGLTGKSSDAVPSEASEAWIDLAALEPRAARDVAAQLLADPRLSVSNLGAVYTAASYLMEGRLADAEAAQLHEIERQRAIGTPLQAGGFATHVARARRWLGRPPPDAELIAAIEANATAQQGLGWRWTRFVSEAALARAAADPGKGRATMAAALDALQARADKAGDRFAHDGSLLGALPLVRALRGDAAAAKLWLEAGRAPFRARRLIALDAGLALEAAGKRAEAEAAYELAMDPFDIEGNALAAMLARSKLAALKRAAGRVDEAAALEAVVDRVWQKADAGLRDAVKRVR